MRIHPHRWLKVFLLPFALHLSGGLVGVYVLTHMHFVGFAWPPLGLGVVALFHLGFRALLGVAASSILLHSYGYWLSGFEDIALVVFLDVGGIALVYTLLTWRCPWTRGLVHLRQLRRLLLVGILVPILLSPGSAYVFAQYPMTAGFLFSRVYSAEWVRLAGSIFFYIPLLTTWPGWKSLRPFLLSAEGLLLVGLTALASMGAFLPGVAIFSWPILAAMMPLPTIFWCSARGGLFLTTFLSGMALLIGGSPALFSPITSNEAALIEHNLPLVLLQVFSVVAICLAFFADRATREAKKERRARRSLQVLVHQFPLALIEWDLDFRVRVWSRQAEVLFGFSSEEATGRFGPDLLFPEEERGMAMETWTSFLASPPSEGASHAFPVSTAEGHSLFCDWYGALLRDREGNPRGVVSMVLDAEERVAADQAARRSRRRLREILETVPQMIAYFSANLERHYANQAYWDAFGGMEAREPTRLRDLVASEEFERVEASFLRALGGETVRFLEQVHFDDDSEHSLERILLPDTDGNGQVSGVISVATDVSGLLRAQEERLALEMQVVQAQKLESLGKLAGRLAHEFNNRLFGILGHADIARQDLPKHSSVAPALGRILDIARDASELCQQMFVYAGHGSGVKGEIDVGRLVGELARLMELSIPRTMQLSLQVERDLPLVRADAAQLRQALMNLVQNAAEASDPYGQILVRVSRVPCQDLDLLESFLTPNEEEADLLELAVVDQGCGIQPQETRQIFEPFHSTRSGAKGLGLAGVLGIVFGHAGAIGVDTTPGGGSTFRIYLPVHHPLPSVPSKGDRPRR